MRGINNWQIVISGFLQDCGEPTGLVRLWTKLQRFASPTTAVQLHTWDADWRAIAELIWQTQPSDDRPDVRTNPPTICVHAFSWGAGYGAMQLAWELHRRGLDVQAMVLSDPVYRHWYALGNWRAFVPFIPIVVPPNVARVKSLAQRQSWPRAHPLIACDPDRTQIDPPIVCHCDHGYMDDDPQFQSLAMLTAAASKPQ